MKFRATKAAGSFDCSKHGSFELLVTMEADPSTLSYAEFYFENSLPPDRAREFAELPAYLLRHRAGLFVICVEPDYPRRSDRYRSCWDELDAILARQGIWLFATTTSELRREPKWSNARRIAHCAQAELDPADQERVIAHLSRVGHASLRSCMTLCAASIDSFDALLRLVSAGILFLDPSDDLSPGSTLRLSPLNPTAWLPNTATADLR